MLYHADDPGQQRVAADSGGFENERPARIDRAGHHFVPGLFADGQRFAGDHAFVYVRRSVANDAVHRDFFARAYRNPVAHLQCGDRNVLFVIAPHEPGGGRLQADQSFNGGRCVAFGAFLEQFADQHECDDYAGGFVIDVRFESAPEPELRVNGVEQAEQESDRRAEGHQRIHVGLPVAQLFPSVDEKAAPEKKQYRQRQYEHDPVAVRHVHEQHGDHDDRQREQPRSDRVVPQAQVAVAFGLLLFDLSALFVDDQVVSRSLDGGADLLRRDLRFVESNRQPVGCEIHRCVGDSGQFPHGLFDAHGAGRAAHFQYRVIFANGFLHNLNFD